MDKLEFLNKLSIELKISKNSPYTLRNYVEKNEKLLDFLKKSPDELTEDDVKMYMSEKLSNYSALSIILFLAAIKYSYSNILKKDITINIKRPKKEKKIPTVLTKDEMRLLLSSCNNKKSKLMISLLYSSGLRVSELVNLKVNNLKFEEKIGFIKQAKGKKDRIFNISDFLFNDLKDYAENRKLDNSEFLFSGLNEKLSSRNIQKIVKSLAKKSGIK